jgi:hypothetical protein
LLKGDKFDKLDLFEKHGTDPSNDKIDIVHIIQPYASGSSSDND